MLNAPLRYIAIFSACCGLAIGGVAGLNYLVDPYDVFGRNRLGVYVAADRESRPAFLKRFPHDAVLMGNSKAAMIDTTQLQGYRFFSATFGGATIEELYFFARNYVKDAKLVVIALDFGMFSVKQPVTATDPFADREWSFYAPFLLSLSTLADSVQTISRYLRGKSPAFRPDGSYIAEKWAATKDVPNASVLEHAFAQEEKGYQSMQFSEQKLDKLRDLALLLEKRQIPVIAVVNPLHERSLALLRGSPAGKEAERWVRKVRQVFPVTVDLRDTKYARPEHFFAADPVHYKPASGVEFMQNDVLPLSGKQAGRSYSKKQL